MALTSQEVVQAAHKCGPLIDEGAGRTRILATIMDLWPDKAVSRSDIDRVRGAWDLAKTEGAAISYDEEEDSYVVTGPVCMDLADLRAAFSINLEEYQEFPEVLGVNNWNVTTSTGRVLSNWQVKARYLRRPLDRLLEPSFEMPKLAKQARSTPPEGYTLYIPDMQIGYWWRDHYSFAEPMHDRRVIDLAFQLMDEYGDLITRVVFLGDNLDAAECSDKFAKKMPWALRDTLEMSVLEMRYILREARRRCPYAEIDVLEGNHGKRVGDYINRGTPALRNLVTLKDLLRVDEVDANYYDTYGLTVPTTPHTDASHGEFHGRDSARKHLATIANRNLVVGHNHSVTSAFKRDRTTGQKYGVYSAGCACRVDFGIVPAYQHRRDWEQALVLEGYNQEASFFEVLRIENGAVMTGGRMLRGKDFGDDVAKFTDIPQLRAHFTE